MKEDVEPILNEAKGIDQSKDFGEASRVQKFVEGGMQIKHIHDVEPVSIQNPGYHIDGEIERMMEKKGANNAVSTSHHRGIGKNE
ncbi:hypothetical protein H5410_022130 [Solanum commersonii]|uniref:Uncharacterized protein n=1 Tax=Solanum commersonii TaxID=4109 RepID=A0A9J5ZDB8_SOLCO|nr:hypothetical protein H5410_022130 [Solanum commersonii]